MPVSPLSTYRTAIAQALARGDDAEHHEKMVVTINETTRLCSSWTGVRDSAETLVDWLPEQDSRTRYYATPAPATPSASRRSFYRTTATCC